MNEEAPISIPRSLLKDRELSALHTVVEALANVDEDSRKRIMLYANHRYRVFGLLTDPVTAVVEADLAAES